MTKGAGTKNKVEDPSAASGQAQSNQASPTQSGGHGGSSNTTGVVLIITTLITAIATVLVAVINRPPQPAPQTPVPAVWIRSATPKPAAGPAQIATPTSIPQTGLPAATTPAPAAGTPSATSTPPAAAISTATVPADITWSGCLGANWDRYLLKCTELLTAKMTDAKTLLDNKQYDQAIAAYHVIYAVRPAGEVAKAFGVAYAMRSMAFQNLGKLDPAIADLLQALQLDPANDQYCTALGIDFTNRNHPGDQDLSIAILTRGMDIQTKRDGKSNGYTSFRRGMAYRLKGDFDHAIADDTYAVQADPTYRPPYSDRGLAYIGKQDYADAIPDFTKLIQLNADNPWAFYYRGLAYRGLDDCENATADFNQVLSLATDQGLNDQANLQLSELKATCK